MITTTKELSKQRTQNYFLSNLIEQVEKNRFAFMASSIVFGSAWGSVALYYILLNKAPLSYLIICTVFTMASNALNIAQVSGKHLLISLILGFTINSALLIASVI